MNAGPAWNIWVWWISGGVAGVVGLGVLVQAETRNPSRGRKRRRRLIGRTLIGLGIVAAGLPVFRSGGYVEYVPGWLLVRIAPVYEATAGGGSAMFRELQERGAAERLSDDQRLHVYERYFEEAPVPIAPVRARNRWPIDVPISVALGCGVTYPWCFAPSLSSGIETRVRIHRDGPRGRFEPNKHTFASSWIPLHELAQAGAVSVDVQILKDGVPVWERTMPTACVVGGTVDEVLPRVSGPDVDAKVRAGLDVEIDEQDSDGVIVLSASLGGPFGPDVACGCTVELLHHGAVFARGHYLSPGRSMNSKAHFVMDRITPGTAKLTGPGWEARFRGSQELGLRCMDIWLSGVPGVNPGQPTRCWVGEVTVPIAMPPADGENENPQP